MEDFLQILSTFNPISLGELDAVKLLDRMDLKFLFNRNQVEGILAQCSSEYRVLTISDTKFSQYETSYFDTPDLEMYIRHHNGKLNRHKVRFRRYIDSDTCFFEIKFKSNKGRTVKDRVKLPSSDCTMNAETEKLLQKKTRYISSGLKESIRVNYNRITLVRNNLTERMTIDFNLHYSFNGKTCGFPDLVIAEVKQDRTTRSPFVTIMQSKYIPPYSLSKYCLGIASLYPDVKKNNFKPKLLHVNKVCTHQS